MADGNSVKKSRSLSSSSFHESDYGQPQVGHHSDRKVQANIQNGISLEVVSLFVDMAKKVGRYHRHVQCGPKLEKTIETSPSGYKCREKATHVGQVIHSKKIQIFANILLNDYINRVTQ
jgi:hypothetical protein